MATAQRMTPGVYIEEKNAFPNSVVEVATAIPVFIGYTESAAYKGKSYTNKAVKVTSMVDYNAFFGGAPAYKLSVLADSGTPPATPVISESITLNGADYLIAYDTKSPAYYMYNSIRLFYQNGGGNCYVISIGDYSNAPAYEDLYNGLKILENEFDPTLIVIPDSLMLTSADWQKLAGNMFEHCYKFQNRMSLFDVYDGYISDKTQVDDIITNTRTYLGTNYLNYGATYFPWLVSSVVDTTEISIMNISEPAIDDIFSKLLETDTATAATLAKIKPNVTNAISAYDSAIKANDPVALANAKLSLNAANNALLSASANYTNIILGMQNVLNTLPAAPAMAGIYTAVDNARGVWKAPANVSLNAVIKPTINLNDDQQADLNIDAVTGKSINVIRSFVGQGVLVWGARTLEGNSQDWRYVSVRRTLIMIEQSVKLAARAYVFEPNDANTWASVKSMLENFLNSLWKKGALVGSKADDAYSVSVGLGSTMTGDDILNGYMLITVLVAVSHPAEFIVITFQQQMQKS